MSIQLREYQYRAIEQIRKGYADGRRSLLLVLPTGAEKTTVAAFMILNAMMRGKKCLFLAHRIELVDQAADRLAQMDVYASKIVAGRKGYGTRVTVASIPTLTRRVKGGQLPEADLVIVDEAHHSTSAGFRALISHYREKGAFVIGLTATPYRLDNEPLGELYEEIIAPIPMSELIQLGHLVRPRYFAPQVADFSDIRTKFGEYKTDDLFQKFDKVKLYGDTIEIFRKHAHTDRPTIVFCVNVEHSKKTCEVFCQAGYNFAHVDGAMPTHERLAIFDKFKKGKILGLCNVNIATEGFDLPEISNVLVDRKTKSKSLWKQMVGRGLRPAKGKDYAIVIDFGSNITEHGMVEWPEEYTLFPEKKQKGGSAPIKVCPECDSVTHISAKVCKDCGYEFSAPAEGELKRKNADFFEVGAMPLRPDRTDIPKTDRKDLLVSVPEHLKGKKFSDMTRAELTEYARHMGYKQGWVYHQMRVSSRLNVLNKLKASYS